MKITIHSPLRINNLSARVAKLARIAAMFTLFSAIGAEPEPTTDEITGTSGDRLISGVYPHLTAYSQSLKSGAFSDLSLQECGIGAVIPWAGKLWMITYAPHKPDGSSHKLYSIDEKMNMTIQPESVGGTPAARMIHAESEQLIIGSYFIDKAGKVRVISPKVMPGRITAVARHLTDPANKIYVYGMEGELYEVEVHSLAVTRLFADAVPGVHGKGAYTAQGLLVVANNGESYGKTKDDFGGLDRPENWAVSKDFAKRKSLEDRGVLATFDGTTWNVIERRQYTDVTGPQGVRPTADGANLPLWAIGWDKRALRLQVLSEGKFHLYLLPKGSLNNDPSHGWFTEWPRIREIGGGKALLDMHGMFYDFPLGFKPGHTGGLQPIGRHLRYVPDFCDWNGRLVIATDEASVQGNPLCGQPQSNLWFGTYADLKTWGDASATGAIWVNDPVPAGIPSAPFLIKGFKKRIAHFFSDADTTFALEIDRDGSGHFEPYTTVELKAGIYSQHLFPADFDAQWIRVTASQACTASVAFSFSDNRFHDPNGAGAKAFAALADVGSADKPLTQWIAPDRESRDLKVITVQGEQVVGQNQLNAESLRFAPTTVGAEVLKKLQTTPQFTVDAASVVLKSRGKTLRLPKGDAAFDKPFADGWPRSQREVESERGLANIHGTFYEVPLDQVGQPEVFYHMKPISSHNKQIMDYCTWRGMLILSGVKAGIPAANNVFVSDDGKQALWAGGIDDLWQLGKPVGHGGPWKDTEVKAGIPSDPYLMNGYDRKRLTLKADRDCTVDVEVDFDLQSGFKTYKTFALKAGDQQSYEFPDGFAAHWVRFTPSADCRATAQLVYE